MADERAAATPELTPSTAYARGVAQGRWQDDPAQRNVLPALDRIHAALASPGRRSWFARFVGRTSSVHDVRGLYLWGGVGRGKTFLVDLLASTLPDSRVLRRHFHRFMGKVHAALNEERGTGRAEPLAAVAERIARRCRVLCLDEFVVNDIGDAMILSGLLDHLLEVDVTLVTTSNTEPSGLYRDGLQRARFEPAIALIQRHCEVIELASPTDYRLRSLIRAPVFLVPAGADADARLRERFGDLAPRPEIRHPVPTAARRC